MIKFTEMIKSTQVAPIHLPSIRKPRAANISSAHRSSDYLLESLLDEENDRTQVQKLDHWTARNYQEQQRKNTKLLGSKAYKKQSLYRESLPKKLKTIAMMNDEGWLMQPKMYLLRLDSELKKVQDINYDSMYKNIEYCSGYYENFYADILRVLDKFIEDLTARFQKIEQLVKKKRLDHIKSMETLHSSAFVCKINISQTRENIEIKENEAERIRIVIEQLQNARNKVFKHCLMVGYDVREDGLLWIIRELGYFPQNQEFPSFLNEKEINYIRNKYDKEQQLNQTTEGIVPEDLGKTSDQVYEIVTRKKKRELSMIREGEILKQLTLDHNACYSNDRHKYINEEVLRMAEVEFPKTKATQYEIIYKQTSKKLNKYCINQIYKKSSHQRKQKNIIEARKESMNTLKILSHFQAKIEDHMRKANKSPQFQSQEEKELDQIIRSLRYESYQDSSKLDHSSRNVITILCCLLGSKKAKRIAEQELNHLF